MSVILTVEKDINILKEYFNENLTDDTIHFLERKDITFIDNNTFIISISKLKLDDIKDL